MNDSDHRYYADADLAARALDNLIAETLRRGLSLPAVLSGIHGALIAHYIHAAGWQFAAERCRAAAEQIELGFRLPAGTA